ncbi:MAG: hypothetical protein E6Q97_29750 [Desulfurellales bacterium]|nr:MAG: hypothetical protein E6Q97_29750 [Desulfurellales bacterium]
MNLRPYQARLVDAGLSHLHESPVLVLPTGGGKTVVACEIIRRLDGPIYFVAHRREIILQTADRLSSHGVDCGVILGGHPRNHLRVQVASVQTLRSVPTGSVVIIDEAHHATSRSYLPLFSGTRVIGLTATPFRLDGTGLGTAGFRRVVVGAYTDELLSDGFLVRPRIFSIDVPSLAGVAKQGGDFAKNAVSAIMSKPKLVADIVSTWKARTPDSKTVAFATSVAHSEMIRDAFLAAGVPAFHIDGKTPKPLRDQALVDLRVGTLKVVTNAFVLGEGWDLPALETLIDAQPTASHVRFLQKYGRVMRPYDGKTPVVLDHAGNAVRFPDIEQRLDYTLDGAVKPKGEPLGLKRCKDCLALVRVGISTCPHCGATFASDRPMIATKDGELVEIRSAADRRKRWSELKAYRASQNLIPTWSISEYVKEFGRWPNIFSPDADLSEPTIAYKQRVYTGIIDWFATRGPIGRKTKYSVDRMYEQLFGVKPRGFPADPRFERTVYDCKCTGTCGKHEDGACGTTDSVYRLDGVLVCGECYGRSKNHANA